MKNNLIIKSVPIKGKGRGKLMGFPTINLAIPEDLNLADGIYAAWVLIKHHLFKGAVHYGPIPTFSEEKKSLEVFLVDTGSFRIPDLERIIVEINIIKRIRDVKKFATADELIQQIKKDVKVVRDG